MKITKNTKVIGTLIILVLVLLWTLSAIKGFIYTRLINDVSKSHVEANFPERAVFDSYLLRDLNTYFDKNNKKVSVKYEFLRNGPTQSGIAYSKYYLWVSIFVGTSTSPYEKGAVRVVAIDKQSFGVTDYISEIEAKNNPEKLYEVFPSGVVQRIQDKINSKF